ncbi:MAG TPA: protein kinase [Candidatus Acidoferrales bacterium]|nr:protein kinase [Candidatus Acidoferrales bacterium]
MAGTLLAGRYRIVAPAGKGGMGEVYRAEDLKLSQVVALKFVPTLLASDGAALARFHREVRVARQVSHPNVCRVFDIGETEGQVFLSMEFVDGEDLSSLLRRIGRLPSDKAVEIARQLCAGLAAAHEHGVLHRDLKPSNVMIDGRGKARITDFGLSGLAGEFRPDELRAGTPAYMAPEQLEGKEVTVRSDIYSLGLVLYELFTGKRAFEAATVLERKDLLEQTTPTSPSSHIKDLDPVVERVILRCLERDPRKRPASALQVAAALPGGDPLAAALAAGETPSPEMVAASGMAEGLRPAIAWLCLAGVAVGVLASILLSAQTKLYRRVPLEKPPEVLAEQARAILQSVGHTEAPADTAVGFYEENEYLRYVREHDQSPTRWNNLENAFVFWYRSSPAPLGAKLFLSERTIGSISPDDPPLDVAGMTLARLTPHGRLTQLIVVPPQVEKPVEAVAPPDWAPLFSAAGLEPSQWTPAQPTWTPPVFADSRSAWTGALPERPEAPMRIEAAAYQGKPVYFELIGPWTQPKRVQTFQATAGFQTIEVMVIVLLVSLLAGAAWLARRNLRAGRSDRRGAARLAAFVLAAAAVEWVFGAHHVPTMYEVSLLVMFLGAGLFVAAAVWILYIALEPFVRRRWPATLVSWSRLLVGHFRDPLVGRDVLMGCLLTTLSVVVARVGSMAAQWLGYAPVQPYGGPQGQFLGARAILSAVSGNVVGSIFIGLATLFFLFVLRVLLRKGWAGAVAFVLFMSAVDALAPTGASVVFAIRGLILYSLTVFLLVRFGLLAFIASGLFGQFLGDFPLTTDTSAWYAGIGFAGILLMAAMAFYSFYTSLGGRPMFGAATLEE